MTGNVENLPGPVVLNAFLALEFDTSRDIRERFTHVAVCGSNDCFYSVCKNGFFFFFFFIHRRKFLKPPDSYT